MTDAMKYQLAERVYALDEEVYNELGSSLGRVFNGWKQQDINSIKTLMDTRSGSVILREEMALISNMARTIENDAAKEKVMAEYTKLSAELQEAAATMREVDVIDDSRLKVNQMSLANRYNNKGKRIICISRPFGSAGNDIGFALATELHINYYDVKIIEEVLNRMQETDGNVWDEKSSFYMHSDKRSGSYKKEAFASGRKRGIKDIFIDFSRFHGLRKEDAIFFYQSQLILDIANNESCVIMGRCADVILTNKGIPHVSLFISAPMEQRILRAMELYPDLNERKVQNMLKNMDRDHKRYYKYYTGKEWGNAANYDLSINSASHGIDGCVELIRNFLEMGGVDPVAEHI